MSKKIGILIENRFIEKEIFYYQSYFANKGFEVVLLTRLWGQSALTFKGLEFQAEITASNSFEELSDEDADYYNERIRHFENGDYSGTRKVDLNALRK